MSNLKSRPTQTKVKHAILKSYLDSWGGIILNGLKRQNISEAHFVYVDCNASFGRFDGELEDAEAHRDRTVVFGSPIIAIQALDLLSGMARGYGINLRTSIILVEMQSKAFTELQQSLDMAGLSARVRKTDAFATLQNGEIAIVKADSTKIVSQLTAYTRSGGKFSFFFLDPYGPKAIPWSFVREIIYQPKHDAIINMPYQDLHKKSGIASKSLLTPEEHALLKNYDDMFGHKSWQTIARKLDTDAIWQEWDALPLSPAVEVHEDGPSTIEIELMNCYRETLQSKDKDLTVKSIGLRFPDKERTMFYLYLTTHDPSGALQMNEILWKAGYQENELRWKLKQTKQCNPGQESLLDLLGEPPVVPAAKRPERASKEEIASRIFVLLAGKTLKKRAVYQALVDEPYFAREIDSALKRLKKDGKASFDEQFRNDTLIHIKNI